MGTLGGLLDAGENGEKWVAQNEWIRDVPMHLLKMEPGMGITLPSKAYHSIMANDGNRILMDCFFVSRFKALENSPAAADDSYYKRGTQGGLFRAMRLLKMMSLMHLWETRNIGGFFSG